MAQASIGVIGGSGLYAMEGLSDVQEVKLSTPFGDPSDVITIGTVSGKRVAFLPRHGRGHRIMPSELPNRANIWALKSLGVAHIISVSACGSLRADYAPRTVVIPNQSYDHTKGRVSTFFGGGLVVHTSFAEPFCPTLSDILYNAVKAAGGQAHQGGVYITIEGPMFSSKGESHIYRQWGIDIIGMTCMPEARLAREAEICYATMAHITDYDVWHESAEPVTLQMVLSNLNANVALAQQSLKLAFAQIGAQREDTCACPTALKEAIVTSRELVPPQTQEQVKLLTAKYWK